jgi:DNA-binding NtrC family response regulator
MAARVLKIDRVTLYNKIKKYGFKKAAAESS